MVNHSESTLVHGVRHGLKLGGARVKVRGMLLSYFVKKLIVIKCLFNYDNAIIINTSKIHKSM